MVNLKEIISAFEEFREEIVTKRTVYDLNKARTRAHILIGLVVANENIDKPTAIFGCLFKRVKISLILSFIVSSGGFTQADLDVPVLFIGYLYLILGSSTP